MNVIPNNKNGRWSKQPTNTNQSKPNNTSQSKPNNTSQSKPNNTSGSRPRPASAVWITNPSTLCPNITTDKEITEYANLVFKHITKNKTVATKVPQLIIPIGAPGAGKSTIIKALIDEHSDVKINNYVDFDIDNLLDYISIGNSTIMDNFKNIPDMDGKKSKIGYAYGWEECMEKISGKIVHLVILKLLKSNYNLIMNIHNYYEIIIDAQLKGYFCILVYVAVSKPVAIKRANDRAFETGKFLKYGWDKTIDSYLSEYREKAVWYALWADRFVVVNNNINNYYPTANDFKILITHPSNTKEPTILNWRTHVKKMYSAIDKVNFSKQKN